MNISRDGKTLLFDEQGEQSGPNYTVAMRDITGSPPVALGEGMAGDSSPDAKWVATTISHNQLLLLRTGAGTVRRIERATFTSTGLKFTGCPTASRSCSQREVGLAALPYGAALKVIKRGDLEYTCSWLPTPQRRTLGNPRFAGSSFQFTIRP